MANNILSEFLFSALLRVLGWLFFFITELYKALMAFGRQNSSVELNLV
jgi:hypothetical protein